MGERKGQNFYYPPDFDYKKHKSLNSYHGTHALRERAAKIKQGILIIRFEMPFNIWCLGCNNHVGMGVRYNAEKKKVGMYYTTPLYEFRMKCHLCDNYFVIRTDPEHFDYELVEGCRRQEKRYDPSTIAQLGAVDRTFNRQLEADKMFKVEHVEKDKEKLAGTSGQIDKLEWVQERMRDDFAANQALRRSFRQEKEELKEQRAVDEDLLKRSSLEMKLLPETSDDRKTASLITRYRHLHAHEESEAAARSAVMSRPIFSSTKKKASASLSAPKTKMASFAGSLRRPSTSDPFEGPSQASARTPSATSIGVVLKKARLEDTPSTSSASGTSSGIASPTVKDDDMEDERRMDSDTPSDRPEAPECSGMETVDGGMTEDLPGGESSRKKSSGIGLVADYGSSSSPSESDD